VSTAKLIEWQAAAPMRSISIDYWLPEQRSDGYAPIHVWAQEVNAHNDWLAAGQAWADTADEAAAKALESLESDRAWRNSRAGVLCELNYCNEELASDGERIELVRRRETALEKLKQIDGGEVQP
jgi:hypothetical protein